MEGFPPVPAGAQEGYTRRENDRTDRNSNPCGRWHLHLLRSLSKGIVSSVLRPQQPKELTELVH